ncbi:hypothetical protein A9X75_11250 [Brachyspira hyodysenteriae]|uniref:DUF1848 domain-containing protein n=1 Tax=Brachyspira hyodysenteriae TaxID=159 RepID=UPI001182414E|nr:DUF1848 domain-containing protein [Brachyspira hyodysenteriae]TVL65624.1 hypothetical protein A9X75_11250 [Brachyspira hyodysenteriae]
MIVSASRRTDIPSYYSEWFFNRIKEKYVLVRNPINIYQVSKIDISPDIVDCIVFWSKNPAPMLDKLDLLKHYKYYFQFTVTSYGDDIEKKVPSKNDKIFDTFKKLSDKIGSKKVIWRYDPIMITDKYNIDYHKKYFEKIAKHLHNYTQRCTISFMDIYAKVKRNMKNINFYDINNDENMILDLTKFMSEVTKSYNMSIDTCAETMDLSKFGITHGKCIDDKLISDIVGYDIKANKDKNQRLPCGCIESFDIGAYNTCLSKCVYCYANYSEKKIDEMHSKYDKTSPLLCDSLTPKDKITDKKVSSFKTVQPHLNLD